MLDHVKSLQIYFCVMRQAKGNFLKDIESGIVLKYHTQF